MRPRVGRVWIPLTLLLPLVGCDGEKSPATEMAGSETPRAAVVVWAADGDLPVKLLLAAYAKASGVPVETVTEGQEPPARTDLVVTSDMGMLWRLGEEGGLRPTYSPLLESNVPAPLRDPDSMWFGVAWNPLVIAYDPRAIDTEAPASYAALSEERWQGRLCVTASAVGANRLLLASLIADMGEPGAERLVRGWMANLGDSPFEAAGDLLAAIMTDRCDVGVVEAGAVGGARAGDPGLAVQANAPDSGGGAVAIVTAAGVTRHATNPEGAVELLEWLSGEAAQTLVAAESMALPANPSVPGRARIPGSMPVEPFDAARAASRLGAAALLAERAGYR